MDKASGNRVAAKAATDKGVRMYPANSLKQQVREPKDTLSAFLVLKAELCDKN